MNSPLVVYGAVASVIVALTTSYTPFAGIHPSPTLIHAPPSPCSQSQLLVDRRFVAASLADAVKYFPDLTRLEIDGTDDELLAELEEQHPGEHDLTGIHYGSIPSSAEVDPTAIGPQPSPSRCKTKSCKACSSVLLDRLVTIGMIDDKIRLDIAGQLGATGVSDTSACKRLEFSDDASVLRRKRELNLSESETRSLTWDETSGFLSTKFEVACLKPGEPVARGSPWTTLCGHCWVWRETPEGHVPRYINEVHRWLDDTCLEGKGQCLQTLLRLGVHSSSSAGRKPAATLTVGRHVTCAVSGAATKP